MAELSRQALVADIGHTSMRFALADIDELTIRDFAIMSTPMFSNPAEALEAYLRTVPDRPSLVAVTVAGPTAGGAARLSRGTWSFSVDDIRRVIDADVCFINDIEALASLLPHLVEHDIHSLGGQQRETQAPTLVLGVGTTVSMSASIATEGEPLVVASRCDAIAFAARTEADLALARQAPHEFSYISAGDVLSGSGLVAIEHASRKATSAALATASDVIHAAHLHQQRSATRALDQFASWLGGFAADMTLAYGAGAVYLAGGLPRAMLEELQSGSFRAAFEARGSATEMLARVPVKVITAPDAGLRAAALAGARLQAKKGALASAA